MNFMGLPAIVLHQPTTLCSVFPHYSFCSNVLDIFKLCAHNSSFSFSAKYFCFRTVVFFCFFTVKKKVSKAVSLRDLYAPNRIFFRNTASKIPGRRQPCRGLLSCLAGKSLVLECFAVLNGRFLFAGTFRGRRNTGCISRTMNFLRTKRFFQNRANP